MDAPLFSFCCPLVSDVVLFIVPPADVPPADVLTGLKWDVQGTALASVGGALVSCFMLCGSMIRKGMVRVSDIVVPPSAADVYPLLQAGFPLALRNVISFGEGG